MRSKSSQFKNHDCFEKNIIREYLNSRAMTDIHHSRVFRAFIIIYLLNVLLDLFRFIFVLYSMTNR